MQLYQATSLIEDSHFRATWYINGHSVWFHSMYHAMHIPKKNTSTPGQIQFLIIEDAVSANTL